VEVLFERLDFFFLAFCDATEGDGGVMAGMEGGTCMGAIPATSCDM
jgi:hypothetical protein